MLRLGTLRKMERKRTDRSRTPQRVSALQMLSTPCCGCAEWMRHSCHGVLSVFATARMVKREHDILLWDAGPNQVFRDTQVCAVVLQPHDDDVIKQVNADQDVRYLRRLRRAMGRR